MGLVTFLFLTYKIETGPIRDGPCYSCGMNLNMSAWQLSKTAPQGLDLVQRPKPRARRGEVVVRLLAAALNYRDLMARAGNYGEHHPIIPLVDGVGEIVELGDGVTQFKVGDRVSGTYFPRWTEGEMTQERVTVSPGSRQTDGVLADYFVVAEESAVAVPAYLTDAEAATVGCAAVTAWNALFETYALKPGETVLILGTGGVSIFGLQLAKLAGARVIITSSDDAKLERARALGADETINYRRHPKWSEQVLALTNGRGVDLALDNVGGSALNQVVDNVRHDGTVALIGVLGGVEAPVSTIGMLVRNTRVHGLFVASRAQYVAMNRAISLHQLKPVVDRVFPFTEARAAYDYLESAKHFGKVVIAR